MSIKKGLLERLEEGVVVGDGGIIWQLEKRGYVKFGSYTPEAVIERPNAVENLHQEFLDAGADVVQAFTFYASDDWLSIGTDTKKYTCDSINKAACEIAKKVGRSGDALVAAGLTQMNIYKQGADKATVIPEFQKQVNTFVECGMDFIIAEFFQYVEEIEWAIEVAVKSSLPVVATMCIGPEGDASGVSAGECGVRMAEAGAHVVGVNCLYDPETSLKTIKLMKEATEAKGIKVHFISQPLGFHSPEAHKDGYYALPDYPFAMEGRQCTRFDYHKYAREAYDLGVRYIGGCCGTEAYHIRAIVQELEAERGPRPKSYGCEKHEPWGGALTMSACGDVRAKASRQHWENLKPERMLLKLSK